MALIYQVVALLATILVANGETEKVFGSFSEAAVVIDPTLLVHEVLDNSSVNCNGNGCATGADNLPVANIVSVIF